MDVTTLGIKLDAQPFLDGERKVTESLGRISQSASQATTAFEVQARSAQTAFGAMTAAVTQSERIIVLGMNHIAAAAKAAGETMEASGRKGATGASAFQGISAAAQQQIGKAFDAVAAKLASVGTALDAHATKHRETFTAIEAAVTQSANKVGTALSSVTDKLGVTNSALDKQAASAQSGFVGLERNAERTSTAVNTMTTAVNQVPQSVAAATTAVTGMATATSSLSATAAGVGTATQSAARSVDQFAGGVRRRSWETAESFERQRQAVQASFAAIDNAARTTSGKFAESFNRIRASITQTSPALGEVVTAVGRLGSGFASAAAGIRSFAVGIGVVTGVTAAFMAVLAPLAAAILAINAAMRVFNATVGLFSDGLQQASRVERLTLGFAELIGNINEAEKRMTSLRQMALGGVFSLEEFVAASRILQETTDGLWSNESALKAVGNAAAASNRSIAETAKMYGGLLQALQSGSGWEEKIKDLRNANLVTPEVYRQIGQMVEGGARVSQVWAVVMGELDKTSGAMDRLGNTYQAKVRAMMAQWNEFKLILGEAIMPAAKDALDALVPVLQRLIRWAQESKTELEAMADSVVAVMNVMMQPDGFRLTMTAAGDAFAEAIDRGFGETSNMILAWVNDKFGIDIKAAWNEIRNADIWSTLENDIIPKIAQAMANALKRAVIEALTNIADSITFGFAKKLREEGVSQIENDQGVFGKTTNFLVRRLAEGQAALETPLPSGRSRAFSGTATAPSMFNLSPLPRTTPFGPETPPPITVELPESYVPPAGATGAELLPDIGKNTTAIQSLTDVISDVRRQSPARRMEDQGPQAELFGGMGPDSFRSGGDFATRFETERARMQAQRRDESQAMQLREQPSAQLLDAQVKKPKAMPTRRALAVERDPMQIEAERITEQMRNPEEVYRDTVANLEKLREKFGDTGKFTAETFNRAINKAKEDYVNSVKAMEAAAKAAAEAQMTELQKLGANWTDLSKQIDAANVQIAQSIANNLTNAFVGIIDGTKSAGDAFAEMADRIVADLLRIITQMTVANAIGQAIGFFNPVAGQAATAALMPAGVSVGTRHEGGIVGEAGPSRVTDQKIFKAAPRYHQGGMVGLQPGEVPIIAQKGEVITTEDQERMRERLRGDTQKSRQQIAVTNVNVVDATMIDEHLNKNPDAIINLISRQKSRVKQILNIGS